MLEVLGHQINDVIPFPSQRLGRPLPQDLEYVIMSCLAKDPADRPSSAVRLAETLRGCDCGTWSEADARSWWEEYAEALRGNVVVDEGQRSWARSELEVAVDATLA